MNVQQIVDAALARGAEFGAQVPNSFDVSLRRVQAHQEVLFAMIADVNRDYIGRDLVLALTTGSCDTANLDPLPLRIVRVFIEDHGTAPYLDGTKINIVPIDDLISALPPRATLRDGILAGINGELDLVTSVHIWYAKRPQALDDGTSVPDLPAQYHELLVCDLARSLVRKTIGLNATSRTEIVAILNTEYEEMLGDLQMHLRNYNFAETTRHGKTARPANAQA